MHIGDKVGIICCSDGIKPERKLQINMLQEVFDQIGLKTILSPFLYEQGSVFPGTAEERAEALMSFYHDQEIASVFDVSGGNIANGILDRLDYSVIARKNILFWGYSDLTTIINAIYTKTGKPSVLYQVRNLIGMDRETQLENFRNAIFESGQELFKFKYQFIQGRQMEGTMIGGNTRCLLKLAGTAYWPDCNGKILLLESLGGQAGQIASCFSQLKQLGAFEEVSGILLGTFTEMETNHVVPDVLEIACSCVGSGIPIAKTAEIGHGDNSNAVLIGTHYFLSDSL